MENRNFDYRIIGNGKITVVIETGIGNSYFDWLPVADHLREDYTVVLYHRRGYGRSVEAKIDRSTYNIANELFELVNELHIEKFILLAHSFGGLCAQHFSLLYPNRLSGMILVDSASPRLIELEKLDTPFLNEHCSIDAMILMNMKFSKKTKEEMIKLQEKSIIRNQKKLSADDFKEYKEFITSSIFNETVANEFSEWINDGEEIQKNKSVSNIPIKIICRDEQLSVDNWAKNGVPKIEAEIHERHWRILQEDLRTISNNSELIIARGCDHMIHIENPKVIYETLNSLNLLVTKYDKG